MININISEIASGMRSSEGFVNALAVDDMILLGAILPDDIRHQTKY